MPAKKFMPRLTLAQLEELREDAMAEDVEIDLARMSLWSLEQARVYFELGGEEEHEIDSWLRTAGLIEYATRLRMHFPDLDAIRERMLAYVPKGLTMEPHIARNAQSAAANKVLDTCGVMEEQHRKTLRTCLSAIAMFDIGNEDNDSALATLNVSQVRLESIQRVARSQAATSPARCGAQQGGQLRRETWRVCSSFRPLWHWRRSGKFPYLCRQGATMARGAAHRVARTWHTSG